MYHNLVEAYEERWTHADELLALILEAVDRLDIHMVQAWSDKKTAKRVAKLKPFRYKRPAERLGRVRPRRSTINEIIAFFRR